VSLDALPPPRIDSPGVFLERLLRDADAAAHRARPPDQSWAGGPFTVPSSGTRNRTRPAGRRVSTGSGVRQHGAVTVGRAVTRRAAAGSSPSCRSPAHPPRPTRPAVASDRIVAKPGAARADGGGSRRAGLAVGASAGARGYPEGTCRTRLRIPPRRRRRSLAARATPDNLPARVSALGPYLGRRSGRLCDRFTCVALI
jgi:hypothetical protein